MSALSSHALSRRTLLKGGAVAGGTAVWMAPVVRSFSMTAAHAATPSGAPTSVTPTHPTTPTHPVQPTQTHQSHGTEPTSTHSGGASSSAVGPTSTHQAPPSHGVDASSTSALSGPGSLANTGPAVSIRDGLAIGAGAIVVGLGATVAGQRKRPMPPRSH